MNISKKLNEYWICFVDLIYPRNCVICNQSLHISEKFICISCEILLPTVQETQNFETRFWGRINFQHCHAFLRYDKSECVKNLLKEVKYNKNRALAQYLGYKMGEYFNLNFELDFDIVIPIPLHPKKEKLRGFNQSALIAQGLSESTGLKIDSSSVSRKKNTQTQTKMDRKERWENVKSIFEVNDMVDIENKKILILDDVVTTGSTLESMAESLINKGATKISFAVLAIAI